MLWPGDVDPGAVVEPLVMLAEQIETVVAAVWRADDGVNVIARWHDIVERDARMVIELDEHDRDDRLQAPVSVGGPV